MSGKYLIIGAQGQLGRDLIPRVPGEVIPVGRDRADLTRPDLLQSALDQIHPDVVINCAAYNFVDRAESEPEAAFAVNALGPRSLAKFCADRGITLVHFSSDYVFGRDATRSSPWTEWDAPGPISVYGASKLAGEHFVQAACPSHIVIRTCGLYGVWGSGGKGTNFVETMLRLAGDGKPLRVVNDQRCTPTYTLDLAEALVAILEARQFGLFHVTNSADCTWHEFATAIFEYSRTKADLAPIASSESGRPARRPAYSVLADSGLKQIGVNSLRPWRAALQAYLVERDQRRGQLR
jgi:dTDP-4-dehydrorhamnose reductase